MGDLIEGFGDEVVLFVAFLTLSLIFLTVFSCFRRPSSPDRAPSAEEEHTPQLEGPEVHPQATEQAPERPGAETGELRYRPQAASPPDYLSRPEATGGTVEQQQDNDGGRQPDTSGRGSADEELGEIHVRLIQATGPGHAREIVVSPNATLQQLRR